MSLVALTLNLTLGVLLVGAFIALNDASGVQIGALIAFMLLGGRLAHPLVSMARLLEEFEQVRAAVIRRLTTGG